MSTISKIEWTETTWNPVVGCTHVSPGCDRCYAATLASGRLAGTPTYAGLAEGGRFNGTVRLLPDRLGQPLGWRRPRRVFVNSMSDVFHEQVPDEFIAEMFAVMALTPQHTYQILTKRHARLRSLLTSGYFVARVWGEVDKRAPGVGAQRVSAWPAMPLPNVWLGVSVETQQWADIRIPALLGTPAAVRFLSAEPLLGPVDLNLWLRPVPDCGQIAGDGTCAHPAAVTPECHRWADCPARGHEDEWHGLDWVIAGGESGTGARPMHPDWVRTLRNQCAEAGVAFFFKQWGEWAPDHEDGRRWPEGVASFVTASGERTPGPAYGSRSFPMYRVGKKRAGRELDGRTYDEYPATVTP